MKSELLTMLGLVLWRAGVQGQRGPQGTQALGDPLEQPEMWVQSV